MTIPLDPVPEELAVVSPYEVVAVLLAAEVAALVALEVVPPLPEVPMLVPV